MYFYFHMVTKRNLVTMNLYFENNYSGLFFENRKIKFKKNSIYICYISVYIKKIIMKKKNNSNPIEIPFPNFSSRIHTIRAKSLQAAAPVATFGCNTATIQFFIIDQMRNRQLFVSTDWKIEKNKHLNIPIR